MQPSGGRICPSLTRLADLAIPNTDQKLPAFAPTITSMAIALRSHINQTSELAALHAARWTARDHLKRCAYLLIAKPEFEDKVANERCLDLDTVHTVSKILDLRKRPFTLR